MLDPEIADALVGVGEGEIVVGLFVGEEGRVEIEPDPLVLGPVDPGGEVAILDLVAVGRLVGVEVEGVQVQPVAAGDVGVGELEIGAQLVGRAGAAGVVAGGLDAAARGAGAFLEPHHVVALPAVHRDRDGREPGDGGLGIDAPVGENIPRGVVGIAGHSCLHFRALGPIRYRARSTHPQVVAAEIGDFGGAHQPHVAGNLFLEQAQHLLDPGLAGGGEGEEVGAADPDRFGPHRQRLDDMGAALDA